MGRIGKPAWISRKPDIYINIIQELHGVRAVGKSGTFIQTGGYGLVEKVGFLTGRKNGREPRKQQHGYGKFFHYLAVYMFGDMLKKISPSPSHHFCLSGGLQPPGLMVKLYRFLGR
jgi:hypothetical protein